MLIAKLRGHLNRHTGKSRYPESCPTEPAGDYCRTSGNRIMFKLSFWTEWRI